MTTPESQFKTLAELTLTQGEQIETLTNIVVGLAVEIRDSQPESESAVFKLVAALDRCQALAEQAAVARVEARKFFGLE